MKYDMSTYKGPTRERIKNICSPYNGGHNQEKYNECTVGLIYSQQLWKNSGNKHSKRFGENYN